MSYPCKKNECLVVWDKYYDPEEKEGMRFRHCSVDDCHEWYLEFKNGGWCESCGINACEICTGDTGKYTLSDKWYCDDCIDECSSTFSQ
jgi:hypothetical protein